MPRPFRLLGITALWLLALVVAVFSARYFLDPPPLLVPPVGALLPGPGTDTVTGVAPYLYSHHRLVFLLHIASGITALTVGLFQFVGSLRDARPALHRALGRVYLGAALVGGATGLPLSFLLLGAIPVSMRPQFYPIVASFVSLSLLWPLFTLLALSRARWRRFAEHRAWMIRSYSLTFAAVSVRLVGLPLILLTGDLIVGTNAAFLSWPLNLVVAEFLIRRAPGRAAAPA